MALGINFAHRPFKDYRAVHATVTAMLVVGAVLGLVNTRSYADFRARQTATRTEISSLRQRLKIAEERSRSARERVPVEGLAVLAEQSRQINRIVRERRLSWSALLDRLERVVPEDVRLMGLQPTVLEGGTIEVRLGLIGRSPESIVQTLAAFSSDPVFSQPSISGETHPEVGQPEGFRFSVSVGYDPWRKR